MIAAARENCVDAIFPGYGFLAERADFAAAVEAAGLRFIGPSSRAMALLGDKIEAKALASTLGMPTVPGFARPVECLEQATSVARELGYPVVLKAASGGGGRGLRVIHHERDLSTLMDACRAEVERAFGTSKLLLEKYIGLARHIEVQLLGDRYGHLVVMPERECSIQRQHQKVLEESPSTLVDEAMRQRLYHDAITIARAVDYDSVGTVEFLVNAQTREHYFLEMNTRLQVEHPVTEAITGIDLIEQMIRVAAGERLALGASIPSVESDADPFVSRNPQDCYVRATGWALEARICAESWHAGGLVPSTGHLHKFRLPEPQAGIRVDAGYEEGDVVSMHFDSLLAKVIARGGTRSEACQRLVRALDALLIDGVETTTGLLRDIVGRDALFAQGIMTTDFLKNYSIHFNEKDAQQALQLFVERMDPCPGATQPAVALTNEYGLVHLQHSAGDVKATYAPLTAQKPPTIGGHIPSEELTEQYTSPLHVIPPRRSPRLFFQGMPITVQRLLDEDEYCLWQRIQTGSTLSIPAEHVWQVLHAPMPGILAVMLVAVGDEVRAQQPVAILESMKMRNVLHAPEPPSGSQALVVRSIVTPEGGLVGKGDPVLEFTLSKL
jgi:acetyl/propionyl-CoA carboxylase alpha subunit